MSFNHWQTAHHILQGANGWILDIDEQLEQCAWSRQKECAASGAEREREVGSIDRWNLKTLHFIIRPFLFSSLIRWNRIQSGSQTVSKLVSWDCCAWWTLCNCIILHFSPSSAPLMRRWPLAQADWQDCFRLPVINNNVHRVYSRRKHVWHCLCLCVLLKQSLVRGHKSLLKQKTPRVDGDVLLRHVLVVRLIYFNELQSSKTKVCLLRNVQTNARGLCVEQMDNLLSLSLSFFSSSVILIAENERERKIRSLSLSPSLHSMVIIILFAIDIKERRKGSV